MDIGLVTSSSSGGCKGNTSSAGDVGGGSGGHQTWILHTHCNY